MIKSIINQFKSFLGYSNPDIHAILKSGAHLIDVRNPDEFEIDHINGAELIPLPELKLKIPDLKDKGVVIIAYCRSGRRSGKATRILRSNGIEAYNGGGLEDMKNTLDE